MDQVCIPGLVPSEDEPPELEVAVGGTTHPMAYRIETVTWGAELLLNERTEQLITFLADPDRRSSVQIGAPGDGVVPITFRKHCPALGPVVNSWTLRPSMRDGAQQMCGFAHPSPMGGPGNSLSRR